MKNGLLLFLLPALLLGCTSGNCRQNRDKDPNKKVEASVVDTVGDKFATGQERVLVYKYDGSLQCGQGKAVSADAMAADLKGVQVFSAKTKPDGLFHIQVCGSPTGQANVFEIDKKDLAKVKKLGFKEWTFE